jgi:hypothetical protein
VESRGEVEIRLLTISFPCIAMEGTRAVLGWERRTRTEADPYGMTTRRQQQERQQHQQQPQMQEQEPNAGFFAALRMQAMALGDGVVNMNRRGDGMTVMSVAYAYDLSDGGGVFDGLEEGMSYIGA